MVQKFKLYHYPFSTGLVKPGMGDYDSARKTPSSGSWLTLPCTRRLDSIMQKTKALFRALLLIALTVSLTMGTTVKAQERPSNPLPNTVWVGADGKFESDPDTALVQFGVSAQEEKLPDATQKASQAAEQIRQLLRANGLDPKDAQISRFTTQPVYDYKNPKRKLVGYRVDANISLKLKDFSKIGPIAQGLANLDVTDTSISYLLEDMDAAKVKAVEDALRRAHNEANAVAQSSGRALGELSYASVDVYEPQPIRPRMAMAAPMAAEPAPPPPTAEFSAEKITVTCHVNALYNLK